MSYLTPGKQPVGYSLDRPTAEKGYNKEQLPRFDRIPHSKLAIALLALKFGGKKSVVLQTEGLGKQRFQGKVVILINEHSTGAAEMVAQFAKENYLATLLGTKTPGHLVARHSRGGACSRGGDTYGCTRIFTLDSLCSISSRKP